MAEASGDATKDRSVDDICRSILSALNDGAIKGQLARDLDKLVVAAKRGVDFEANYTELVDGKSCVLPKSEEHARAMILVAEAFLNPKS